MRAGRLPTRRRRRAAGLEGRGTATSARVLSWVLRAYPRPFRDTYGPDLARCVRDARQALGDVALTARVTFWARVLVDLLRQAARERLPARASRVARPGAPGAPVARRRLGVALILLGAANSVYDVVSVSDSMGILAALLTGLSVAVGAVLLRPKAAAP